MFGKFKGYDIFRGPRGGLFRNVAGKKRYLTKRQKESFYKERRYLKIREFLVILLPIILQVCICVSRLVVDFVVLLMTITIKLGITLMKFIYLVVLFNLPS